MFLNNGWSPGGYAGVPAFTVAQPPGTVFVPGVGPCRILMRNVGCMGNNPYAFASPSAGVRAPYGAMMPTQPTLHRRLSTAQMPDVGFTPNAFFPPYHDARHQPTPPPREEGRGIGTQYSASGNTTWECAGDAAKAVPECTTGDAESWTDGQDYSLNFVLDDTTVAALGETAQFGETSRTHSASDIFTHDGVSFEGTELLPQNSPTAALSPLTEETGTLPHLSASAPAPMRTGSAEHQPSEVRRWGSVGNTPFGASQLPTDSRNYHQQRLLYAEMQSQYSAPQQATSDLGSSPDGHGRHEESTASVTSGTTPSPHLGSNAGSTYGWSYLRNKDTQNTGGDDHERSTENPLEGTTELLSRRSSSSRRWMNRKVSFKGIKPMNTEIAVQKEIDRDRNEEPPQMRRLSRGKGGFAVNGGATM